MRPGDSIAYEHLLLSILYCTLDKHGSRLAFARKRGRVVLYRPCRRC